MRFFAYIFVVCVLFSCSCSNFKSTGSEDDISGNGKKSKIDIDSIEFEFDGLGMPKYLNSVKGHDEKSEIVGNFTGLGIDTLYVQWVGVGDRDGYYDHYDYFLRSNNPNIPSMQLYGTDLDMPSLVYEGDVDGDGKDEWGYLPTGFSSQWRQYYIYNYDNKTKKWRYLYYPGENDKSSLLETDVPLRTSGLEIVEKGPRKGTILINYPDWNIGILDTVVAPTYTPIPEEEL